MGSRKDLYVLNQILANGNADTTTIELINTTIRGIIKELYQKDKTYEVKTPLIGFAISNESESEEDV